MSSFTRWVEAIIERVTARIDYFALYGAKVVTQSGQTVEVVPDDPRLPGCRAELRYGIPGTSAKIPRGARGLLGFTNGDPGRPTFALYEPGDVLELVFGGSGEARGVGRAGDPVALALPPAMLVTGTVGGQPFAGTMTIATPVAGTIAAGSGKVLAAT